MKVNLAENLCRWETCHVLHHFPTLWHQEHSTTHSVPLEMPVTGPCFGLLRGRPYYACVLGAGTKASGWQALAC